jgi:signal transduction histidine kinase
MKIEDIEVNILIVDDRPENLFSLESIIEGPGRNVICAESGNEALKLVLKYEFCLIISDVQMPEMDGFEMVEILRMNPKMKKIPIIFATAISKEEKFVHKGYSEGAVDYMFKPLDSTIVSAKVDVFVTIFKQNKLVEKQNKKLLILNEDKNKFLGMAAHDIRNPLIIIQQYTKLILEDFKDLDSDIVKYITRINVTSNFLHDMVEELLDISKIELGEFNVNKEPVNIHTIIKDSVKMNSFFSNRKKIKILTEVASDLSLVSLDSNKINQVLNNLISNAIKYSESNTKIIIKAYRIDGHFKVDVIDQGKGIQKNELDNLFKAYKTTSTVGTAGEKSTGLGLLIVKKIVEAHGGKTGVVSELNSGSIFSFVLPLDENSIENTKEIKKVTPGGKDVSEKHTTDVPKVLICEDNALMVFLIKRVMELVGITAVFAENGQEGLEQLIKHPEIEYVFTDLDMPIMDGFELANEIKNKKLPVKVYAVTGYVTDDIKEKCISYGMLDCIEKPVSKIQLERILGY